MTIDLDNDSDNDSDTSDDSSSNIDNGGDPPYLDGSWLHSFELWATSDYRTTLHQPFISVLIGKLIKSIDL